MAEFDVKTISWSAKTVLVLRTGISKENLFGVIKAATLTKDEEMMAKCAEFIAINHGTFNMEENPDWEDFCKENPECGFKILKLMMSKK